MLCPSHHSYTQCTKKSVSCLMLDNDVEINSSFFFFLHAIALLFLHRNLFVRALRENPTNPTQSRFAPSFLTTYSSAITVLKVIRRECEREHSLLMRQWPMWVHTISVGVSWPTFHSIIFFLTLNAGRGGFDCSLQQPKGACLFCTHSIGPRNQSIR